jgi:biotin carboxyl carrier protein
MKIKVNGKLFEVAIDQVNAQGVLFSINDKSYFVEKNIELPNSDNKRSIIPKKILNKSQTQAKDNNILSPISGQLVEILVKVGDQVSVGDPIFVIEAMKMQNKICATVNAQIESINFTMGEEVKAGEVLLTLKAN